MEITPGNMMDLANYIRNFNIHYSLLIRRYERFKKINIIGGDSTDIITYFDMIIVQLRALCIENSRYNKNYTAQILLTKVGEKEVAQRIDNMLDKNFFIDSSDLSVRTALKILADNFICHYDNFDEDRLSLTLADIIMNQLKNPYQSYQKVNLEYIMNTLMDCIGEGLRIKK